MKYCSFYLQMCNITYNIVLSNVSMSIVTNNMPFLTRQKYKYMNKSVCITPIDDEMALIADSLHILNEFKKLGFVKREAFVELVMSEDSAYHTFDGMKRLNNFWALRVKDVLINADLRKILENLKES